MQSRFNFRQLFLILGILAFGAVVSFFLLATSPEIQPEDGEASAKIVQVIPLQSADENVYLQAFGSVIPARKVVIKPRVSGPVIDHSEAVIVGGQVKKGQDLVRIDPKDYELALVEKKYALEQARFEADPALLEPVVYGLASHDHYHDHLR